MQNNNMHIAIYLNLKNDKYFLYSVLQILLKLSYIFYLFISVCNIASYVWNLSNIRYIDQPYWWLASQSKLSTIVFVVISVYYAVKYLKPYKLYIVSSFTLVICSIVHTLCSQCFHFLLLFIFIILILKKNILMK